MNSLVVTLKPFLQSGTTARNDHTLANLNFVTDTTPTVIFFNHKTPIIVQQTGAAPVTSLNFQLK